MAHANPYTPGQVETLEQAQNELVKLADTVKQIIDNQKLVQRDDGCLMDCVVVPHTLSDEVVRMIGNFELLGDYAARPYQKGQVVTYRDRMYVCVIPHQGDVVMDMEMWRLIGKAGCGIDTAMLVNALTSTDKSKALTAAQGKVLADLIAGLDDKINGTIATIPDTAFMNAVQEEIYNVIETEGFTLDPSDHSQLDAAINHKIDKKLQSSDELEQKIKQYGVPLGAVMGFPKTVTSIAGFLRLDGAEFDENKYPELKAFLGTTKLPDTRRSDVGMTAYFPADEVPAGWLEFDSIQNITAQQYPALHAYLIKKYGSIAAVPKVEDRFIRNAGNGLAVGNTQADAIRNITGAIRSDDFNGLINNDVTGAFYGGFFEDGFVYDATSTTTTGTRYGYRFNASRVVPTADENRPKAIVFKLCIKAKNQFDDVAYWIKASGAIGAAPDGNAAAASNEYGLKNIAVEFNADQGVRWWDSISGASFAFTDGQMVLTPDGASSVNGFMAENVDFSPLANPNLRYKVKFDNGDNRDYLIFLRDAANTGYYYRTKKQVFVDGDWQIFDLDIGKKPDGSKWQPTDKIKQIWFSLPVRDSGNKMYLDWLVVGNGLSISDLALAKLADRVTALETDDASNTKYLPELRAALADPLRSVEIQLIGDSITWGVGSSGAQADGQNKNLMTNNSWANLLHKWLGASFSDGQLVAGSGVASYSDVGLTALSNPNNQSAVVGTFLCNGAPPRHKYEVGAKMNNNLWEFSAAGGVGRNTAPLKFDLTGDNITFVYCPTANGEQSLSVVELWGNGKKIGEFNYFGQGTYGTEQKLTFPFGRYKMELRVKSANNPFKLEAIKHERLIRVINDGISGSSTGSWLPSEPFMTAAMAKRAEYVFVQLGTNDRVNNMGNTATYYFLTRIAKELMAKGRKPVLMCANATKDNSGKIYTMARVRDAVKRVADELALDFIDNYEATVPALMDGVDFIPDNLHPNDVGYRLMFDNIRGAICNL